MKTYAFKVVVERDDDRWHAYCPALQRFGAATWGSTREEALERIREVVRLVVETLEKDGEAMPDGPEELVQVLSESHVAVTI